MFRVTRWALIPGLVAGWLWLAGPARAVTPEVKDDAGLFTAAAVKRANEIIADVSRRFKKDIVIETYKEVPADKLGQRKSLGDDRFFPKWAEDRFAALRTDGVYVLICENPKKLLVSVGKKTQERDFKPADRNRLRDTFVAGLKSGKRDDALVNGVQFIADTIQSNHRGAEERASARRTTTTTMPAANHNDGGGFNWGGILCWGLLIVGGIWLVFGLIRAFTGGMGGMGGGPGYGGYGGYGGGGFFSSLMGGLFGAAAGMWMYNNFFGGHGTGFGSTAYGSDAGAGGVSGSDEGQVGSTTSDDWGDSGGGDTGGDWGGGDAGGGDWGGGGGDWGGGGGDFGGGGDW